MNARTLAAAVKKTLPPAPWLLMQAARLWQNYHPAPTGCELVEDISEMVQDIVGLTYGDKNLYRKTFDVAVSLALSEVAAIGYEIC